jgi:fumarate reductase subunit C
MGAWWRRDPFFVRYMVREITAVAVAVYAALLLAGLLCLTRGEAAWDAWVQVLRSPLSQMLHFVLLIAMIYHTLSWFEIMPKTMPMMFAGGRRVNPQIITRAGLVAAVLASAALFAAVRSLAS